jgi:hypothetical protein
MSSSCMAVHMLQQFACLWTTIVLRSTRRISEKLRDLTVGSW